MPSVIVSVVLVATYLAHVANVMAAEPDLRPTPFTFVAKVGEPVKVRGTITFSPTGDGCWALLLEEGGRMQLAELKPEFQQDGLRVSTTVHMESDRVGDCVPGPMLFVDAIDVQSELEK